MTRSPTAVLGAIRAVRLDKRATTPARPDRRSPVTNMPVAENAVISARSIGGAVATAHRTMATTMSDEIRIAPSSPTRRNPSNNSTDGTRGTADVSSTNTHFHTGE
jgi:hypothetical protein